MDHTHPCLIDNQWAGRIYISFSSILNSKQPFLLFPSFMVFIGVLRHQQDYCCKFGLLKGARIYLIDDHKALNCVCEQG
jgi:hypothetical protein